MEKNHNRQNILFNLSKKTLLIVRIFLLSYMVFHIIEQEQFLQHKDKHFLFLCFFMFLSFCSLWRKEVIL